MRLMCIMQDLVLYLAYLLLFVGTFSFWCFTLVTFWLMKGGA